MIRVGISHDPGELRDLERRVDASLRALGDTRLLDEVAVFLEAQNRKEALAGLDRYGQQMRPWRVRRGDSDYHGEDYRSWTNRTVLVPFGARSRRADAFLVTAERSKFLGIGYGRSKIFAGFTARAGRIPAYWRARGRDVLGMSPKTRRGLGLLLRIHSSDAHSLLRRGASLVGRAAKSIGGL